MDDPVRVSFLQRYGDLRGDFESLFDGDGSACNPLRESLSGNELQNEVVRALGLLQAVDGSDVGMVQ